MRPLCECGLRGGGRGDAGKSSGKSFNDSIESDAINTPRTLMLISKSFSLFISVSPNFLSFLLISIVRLMSLCYDDDARSWGSIFRTITFYPLNS